MGEKTVIGVVGGRRPAAFRNTLAMMMLLGAMVDDSLYGRLEDISPPKLGREKKRRQLNCRTCIVKKDDPSYCVRCRELNE